MTNIRYGKKRGDRYEIFGNDVDEGGEWKWLVMMTANDCNDYKIIVNEHWPCKKGDVYDNVWHCSSQYKGDFKCL